MSTVVVPICSMIVLRGTSCMTDTLYMPFFGCRSINYNSHSESSDSELDISGNRNELYHRTSVALHTVSFFHQLSSEIFRIQSLTYIGR